MNFIDMRRRLTGRIGVYPLVALSMTCVLLLRMGQAYTIAAAVGGGAMVFGGWLSACIAFQGEPGANAAVMRLLLGSITKLLVVIVVLTMAVTLWHLPIVGLLIGWLVGLVFQALALVRL